MDGAQQDGALVLGLMMRLSLFALAAFSLATGMFLSMMLARLGYETVLTVLGALALCGLVNLWRVPPIVTHETRDADDAAQREKYRRD